MVFDLCNVLEIFQHYMNDIFRDFLDEFLIPTIRTGTKQKLKPKRPCIKMKDC